MLTHVCKKIIIKNKIHEHKLLDFEKFYKMK